MWYLFLAAFVFLILLIILTRWALALREIIDDLKYINIEIRRTAGSERKAWKKERRRLWLSVFLFLL